VAKRKSELVGEEVEKEELEEVEKPQWYKSYFMKALKQDPSHPDFFLVKEYEDIYGEI
jgi:hypothetical protein